MFTASNKSFGSSLSPFSSSSFSSSLCFSSAEDDDCSDDDDEDEDEDEEIFSNLDACTRVVKVFLPSCCFWCPLRKDEDVEQEVAGAVLRAAETTGENISFQL